MFTAGLPRLTAIPSPWIRIHSSNLRPLPVGGKNLPFPINFFLSRGFSKGWRNEFTANEEEVA